MWMRDGLLWGQMCVRCGGAASTSFAICQCACCSRRSLCQDHDEARSALDSSDKCLLCVQAITVLTMFTAAELHAHPLERVWLLLPFFLGSAEIASGVSGL